MSYHDMTMDERERLAQLIRRRLGPRPPAIGSNLRGVNQFAAINRVNRTPNNDNILSLI